MDRSLHQSILNFSRSLPLHDSLITSIAPSSWSPASAPLLGCLAASTSLSYSAAAFEKGPPRAAVALPQSGAGDTGQAPGVSEANGSSLGQMALRLLDRMTLVADPARAMAAAAAATELTASWDLRKLTCEEPSSSRNQQHGIDENLLASSVEASELILLSRTPIHVTAAMERYCLSPACPTDTQAQGTGILDTRDAQNSALSNNAGGEGCRLRLTAAHRLRAMAWAKTGAAKGQQ